MHRTTTLALAAIPLALFAAAPASAKTARCAITSADGSYKGPCKFSAQGKGSFTLEPVGKRYLVGETMVLTVFVVEPALADVRGLTGGGINSRWGEARRSQADRACWKGEDFSVCAY